MRGPPPHTYARVRLRVRCAALLSVVLMMLGRASAESVSEWCHGSAALVNCTLPALALPSGRGVPVCGQTGGGGLKKNRVADCGVCIAVSGVWPALFFPLVDDMTLLHLEANGTSRTNGQKTLFDDQDQWLQLEAGNVTSLPKHRFGFINNVLYVIPFYTAIISLHQGAVTKITWDDTCTCGTCVWSTCAIPYDQCDYNGGSSNCDLRAYVVWEGTDASGRYLTSSGKRESRFRQYSAYSAYRAAADTGTSLANEINSVAGSFP